MPKCRNCHEPIEFIKNPTSFRGKYMPINLDGTDHFKTCVNSEKIQRLKYLAHMGEDRLNIKDPPKEEVIPGG